MTTCISFIDFYSEISSEHVFTNLGDLLVDIASCNYHTNFNNLIADISASFYYKDLKSFISVKFPADNSGPYIIPEIYPRDGEGGIGLYGPIFIYLKDDITGIDLNSLELIVNSIIYTISDSEITALPVNTPYSYIIRYIPSSPFDYDSDVSVSVFAKDRAGNPGIGNLPMR